MASERRLIDADALIHRLCAERDEVQIEHACDIGYHNGLNMAVSMTINAPTVDAVEVVRCKDCEYFLSDEPTICELTMCGAKDDGFCAWGKRKDAEEE